MIRTAGLQTGPVRQAETPGRSGDRRYARRDHTSVHTLDHPPPRGTLAPEQGETIMSTRREVLAGGGAATLGLAATPAAADDSIPLTAATLAAFDSRPLSVLRRSAKVYIGSYRFGVVVRGGAFASTVGGTATAQTTVQLAGVTVEMLQAIATEAEGDLREKLTAAGRQVGDFAELAANREFASAQPTAQPFGKSPAADARLVVQVAPTGRPLLLTHSDSPLTDKSPFDQATARALSRASADMSAVILTPQVIIDFAQVGGSGVSGRGGSASVSVQPGLFLVPLFTNIMAWGARQKIAPEGGRGNLNKRILLGNAGEFVKTSDYSNANQIADWNARVALGTAPAGRMDGYAMTTYQYVVDPGTFGQTCYNGAQVYNRIVAEAMQRFPPG